MMSFLWVFTLPSLLHFLLVYPPLYNKDCQMPVMDGYESTQAIRVLEKERQQKVAKAILTFLFTVGVLCRPSRL